MKPLRPAVTLLPLGAVFELRGMVPPAPGRPMLVEIDGGAAERPSCGAPEELSCGAPEELSEERGDAPAEDRPRPALVDRD